MMYDDVYGSNAPYRDIPVEVYVHNDVFCIKCPEPLLGRLFLWDESFDNDCVSPAGLLPDDLSVNSILEARVTSSRRVGGIV
jgi:hypothetical protein